MRTMPRLATQLWSIPLLIGVLTQTHAGTTSVNALPLKHYRGANVGGGGKQAARLQEECGVTAGCATTDTCNDDGLDVQCTPPSSYVCEHSLPGLNLCESPPLAAMLPCWMSSLDGNLALNEISIPATHDTMAKGVSGCYQDGLANFVHTQTWSLRTMLDAGVRALDIRLRHVDDSFTLEHGIVALPYTFDEDVRDVLESFLTDNPTETVVMFFQINDAGPNTRTAEESFQASMDAYPDLWVTGPTIPTLDEARGKVVLPEDMAREEQNEFEVSFEELSVKKGLIRDFFTQSGPVDNTFRLNYFSGTGTNAYPVTVGAGVRRLFQGTNEVVFEFSGGCLGITMFDFIGEDAIAHIVAQQGTTAPVWDPPGSPETEIAATPQE